MGKVKLTLCLAYNNHGVIVLGDAIEVHTKRYTEHEGHLIVADSDVLSAHPVLSMDPPKYIDPGQYTSCLWSNIQRMPGATLAISGNKFTVIGGDCIVRYEVKLGEHVYSVLSS